MKPVPKNCMQSLKTKTGFLTDIHTMVAFFLEGILNQQSLWFLGCGDYLLGMSPIPSLRHQPTREPRTIIGSWKPMGTSCPSRPGGRTMTGMATWTILCTTASSTLSSAATWQGRHASHFALAGCPCLGLGVERSSMYTSVAEQPGYWAPQRRTEGWTRSVLLCLSRGLRCSHILVLCTKLSANVFIEAQINTYITNHMMFRCWATWVDRY